MRFLLHATTTPRLSHNALKRCSAAAQNVAAKKIRITNSSPPINGLSDEKESKANIKAWGQQCSPACGCVVRFETKVDANTDTITNATYHAKTVLTTLENGRLEPVRTFRTRRPMVTECKCDTLHQLAATMSSAIQSETLSTVRNMTEFQGVRSSPAFRHAVLNQQRLPRTDTHCFDLVEEAFLAMIRGHMPSPRRNDNASRIVAAQEHKQQQSQQVLPEEEHTAAVAATGYGMDRTSMTMSSPSSALYLLDVDPELAYAGAPVMTKDEYSEVQAQPDKATESAPPVLDWVAYVDEMMRIQEENESRSQAQVG